MTNFAPSYELVIFVFLVWSLGVAYGIYLAERRNGGDSCDSTEV